MQLDQDEREDSGDESETTDSNVLAQVGAAPEVFDIDSDDDLEAVSELTVPNFNLSPYFSSSSDSPGVEQSHESSEDQDSLILDIPSTKVIQEDLIPFLENRMSVPFEEPIEPSLDFYEDGTKEKTTSKFGKICPKDVILMNTKHN